MRSTAACLGWTWRKLAQLAAPCPGAAADAAVHCPALVAGPPGGRAGGAAHVRAGWGDAAGSAGWLPTIFTCIVQRPCAVHASRRRLHLSLPVPPPPHPPGPREADESALAGLRAALGFGRTRWVVSGGGSLTPQLDDFYEASPRWQRCRPQGWHTACCMQPAARLAPRRGAPPLPLTQPSCSTSCPPAGHRCADGGGVRPHRWALL